MARINEPFDVLVVSENALLVVNKRQDELTKGKLGVFDLKTGKSLDLNKSISLNNVYFGVGLSDGSPLIAGATPNSHIDYVSYKQYNAATELVITIDNKVDFAANTQYSFSVELSDQSTYQTIGYNRLRKYFSLDTGAITVGASGNQNFIERFVKQISANSGGFFKAEKVSPSTDKKIKLTFTSTYGNGILNAKVTFLGGFDKTATATQETKAVAAQGTGNLVRELEAASHGYRGNIYRVSTIWGLANDDIKLEAKEDKNYNLITIGYVNDIQNSGFRGKEPYTVILAIENTTAFNGIKDKLKKTIELDSLIV